MDAANTEMEDIEQPAVGRPQHTRTSQACQRCRTLKTRCLPSEQPGTCQRCFTSKKECVWAEQPRKPKRIRGPSRIFQVEQKIDGLVASLAKPGSTKSAPQPTEQSPPSPSSTNAARFTYGGQPVAPGSWLPVPTSFEQEGARSENDTEVDQGFLEKLRTIHAFGDDDKDLTRKPGTLFNGSARKDMPVKCDIVTGLLQSGEAEELLAEYRSMSESFPFVPIPENATAQELSATKPMLLLAILVVASWKDHSKQMKLDKRYREELANRTIIRPRKTLSLIQSSIIYLAWYHFVFSHKTQQIYSLLQLTIGIAIDINLHHKTNRVIDFPGRPQTAEPSPEEQRERQRTYIGCYFLSSAIAAGFMKPNLLKYNDYMVECGRRLRQDREYPSDDLIGRLIALRRIDDQISETFNSEDALDLPITDSRIAMNLRFVETLLDEWRRDNNTENFKRTLDLSYSFTDMNLHAIALRTGPGDIQSLAPNTTQLNGLLNALEAGKRFFDAFIAVPVTEYHLISFSDWMRLPIATLTMSRLCIPSDFHDAVGWDSKAAQDRVRLDLYLESLCYRMQGLSTYDKAKQPHPDFWWALRMIMELFRNWYCYKIQIKKAPSSEETSHNMPTPDTMHTFNSQSADTVGSYTATRQLDSSSFSFPQLPLMDANIHNAELPYSNSDNDPFEFMRDMDFDMDHFMGMGIWGSESYEDLGFGRGGGLRF